jgi:drug/metabolite transporter (DMT)-like permease
MILFNEALKIFHLYGAILVLLGIFLANRRKYSKQI